MVFSLSSPSADLSPLEDPMSDKTKKNETLAERVERLEQIIRIIAPRAFTFPVTDAVEEDKELHEQLKAWFRGPRGD